MKPGERVDLIKKLAGRLNQEEWPMMDLILRQFSLPTQHEWDDDKISYIIAMIDRADDDVLQELAGYFGIGSARATPDRAPDFWQDNCYRMFISHRSEDKADVGALQEALACCGISGFVAHVDIRPSREWQEQIELALRTCDGLLAYLTTEFHASEWTDQEVGFALARGVRVVPLDRGALPYGFMGKYQALRLGPTGDIMIAVEIMKVVMSDPSTRPPFSELIIRKLENSPNFATSSKCMTALEAIPVLAPQELTRLKTAYHTNSQFSGVTGMGGRVGRLHAKFGQPWP